MATFKMNPNFEAELGELLRARMQEAFDATYATHAGQPKVDVLDALEQNLNGVGIQDVNRDDEALNNAAAAISEGQQVDAT